MHFSRFLLTAAAATGLVWPVATFAQNASVPVAPPAASLAASPNVVASGDMVSTLQASGHFTVLVKALAATNLTTVLKTTPDLTLFAPTDDAFGALPPAQLALLMAPKNLAVLQKVLTYHLVHLKLDSSKIKGAKGPVETVETGKVLLDGSGAVLKVNDANIIQADVRPTNGLIQVVDKVLVPADVTLPVVTAAELSTATPAGG